MLGTSLKKNNLFLLIDISLIEENKIGNESIRNFLLKQGQYDSIFYHFFNEKHKTIKKFSNEILIGRSKKERNYDVFSLINFFEEFISKNFIMEIYILINDSNNFLRFEKNSISMKRKINFYLFSNSLNETFNFYFNNKSFILEYSKKFNIILFNKSFETKLFTTLYDFKNIYDKKPNIYEELKIFMINQFFIFKENYEKIEHSFYYYVSLIGIFFEFPIIDDELLNFFVKEIELDEDKIIEYIHNFFFLRKLGLPYYNFFYELSENEKVIISEDSDFNKEIDILDIIENSSNKQINLSNFYFDKNFKVYFIKFNGRNILKYDLINIEGNGIEETKKEIFISDVSAFVKFKRVN